MARQKKRGRSFWTPLVAEYEQTSGVTQAEFADKHGVRSDTFRKWLYQVRNERKSQTQKVAARFIEIESTPIRSVQQTVVELGQVRVRLEGLPDPAWLAELSRHVQGGPTC
jgi:transposase-like protein